MPKLMVPTKRTGERSTGVRSRLLVTLLLLVVLALAANAQAVNRVEAATPESVNLDAPGPDDVPSLQEEQEPAESNQLLFLVLMPFIFAVPLALWSYFKRGVVRELIDEQGPLRALVIAVAGITPAIGVIVALGLAMGLGGGTPEENQDRGIDIAMVLGVGGVVGAFCAGLAWNLLPKLNSQRAEEGPAEVMPATVTSPEPKHSVTPRSYCAQCGAQLDPEFNRCPVCAAVTAAPAPPPDTRPRLDRHAEANRMPPAPPVPAPAERAIPAGPCAKCGAHLDPRFARCPHCGTERRRATAATASATLSDRDDGATLDSPRPISAAQIIVMRPNGAATYALHGVTRIGRRRDDNDIVLSDRDVSRSHGAVFFDDDRFYYEDGRSLNGTWLVRNGDTVRVSSRVALVDGDSLVIGASRLVFREARS